MSIRKIVFAIRGIKYRTETKKNGRGPPLKITILARSITLNDLSLITGVDQRRRKSPPDNEQNDYLRVLPLGNWFDPHK